MDSFVADAIFIDAPPERVFAALTEPLDLLAWMEAETAVVDMFEGGSYRVEKADGSTVSGTVTVYELDERLELGDYYHEGESGRRGPMWVQFLLELRDGGVWLTVRQDGLDAQPDWVPFAQATRREWVRATVALKRHVEGI